MTSSLFYTYPVKPVVISHCVKQWLGHSLRETFHAVLCSLLKDAVYQTYFPGTFEAQF